MAQHLLHDFNGGANGASVLPSGNGGDPFSQVIAAGGSTFTFTTTSPIEGAASGLLSLASGGTGYGRLLFSSSVPRMVARYKATIPTLNAAGFTEPLISIRSATTQLGVLALDGSASPNTSKLLVQNTSGGNVTAARSTTAIPSNTVIDFQFAATAGASAGTGRLEWAYWIGGSLIQSYDSGLTLDTGVLDPVNANFGRSPNTIAEAFTVKMDQCEVSELASGWIIDGARTANLTVVPSAGTVPFTVTATTTVTGSTSGLMYAFDWGDGATTAAQSSPVATHSYTNDGTFTVTVTVTV